jgi:hypothetical protein
MGEHSSHIDHRGPAAVDQERAITQDSSTPVEDRGHLSGMVSLHQGWTIDEWLTTLGPHADAFRLPGCQCLVDRLVAADNRRLGARLLGCERRASWMALPIDEGGNERYTPRATSQGRRPTGSIEKAPTRQQ